MEGEILSLRYQVAKLQVRYLFCKAIKATAKLWRNVLSLPAFGAGRVERCEREEHCSVRYLQLFDNVSMHLCLCINHFAMFVAFRT